MDVRIRNSDWESDGELQEELKKYVARGHQRNEILNYMMRDFAKYSWSIRTLDRRMRHFNIYYHDKNVSVNTLKEAVKDQLNGPGKLLGYRAMHLKVRQKNGLNVTRDQVYDVMTDVDREGLEQRQPRFKRKKYKGAFTSVGPNWVLSLDGHDKLMGFQNSTFPLAIYGCIDTASRKILYLKVWTSNSNPSNVGRWYFEYLYNTKKLPNYIRIDKGPETKILSTMQAYLCSKQTDVFTEDEACDRVIYGPSTSNQGGISFELFCRCLLKAHGHYGLAKNIT